MDCLAAFMARYSKTPVCLVIPTTADPVARSDNKKGRVSLWTTHPSCQTLKPLMGPTEGTI